MALALVASTGVARADMASCRQITDSGDRLACYDALPTAADDTTVVMVGSHDAAPSDVDTSPDLSGFYAGFGAGFGIADRLDSNAFSTSNTSPQIDIFAGVNMAHGNMVFGLEGALSARTTETAASSQREYDPDNFIRQWPSFIEALNYLATNPADTIDRVTTISYRETASPTLAVRLGVQRGNALFYIKGGGGVSILDVEKVLDDTGSTYCSSAIIAGDIVNQPSPVSIGCESTKNGSTKTRSDTKVVGKAIGGVGVEYHMDRFFTRLEGEVAHLFWDDGITTIDAKAAVGIRF